MYLKRLEIQGFKTFAKKTVLNFPNNKNGKRALTVIVGPNGSGKSNTADAIRWCLGEQSMKLLRGKKAEDIIFSGSKQKAKSGFAEVSLVFNNEDKAMPIDFNEVTITRRLFRDGSSEYLLNNKAVRLADIQILLAQAGIGQRSYTVIGQGMIDHILTASPEERKLFFDDATGVRGFQIKRHQAVLKLKKAGENLFEVEMLLQEIKPRLSSLKRQVKRLEKREEIEKELRRIQRLYFGSLWWDLKTKLENINANLAKIEKEMQIKNEELRQGDTLLLEIEKKSTNNDNNKAIKQARERYKLARKTLAEARRRQFEAERKLELAKIKTQSNWTPLPLAEIIKELDHIINLPSPTGEKILKLVKELRKKLTRPDNKLQVDPKLEQALKEAQKQTADALLLVEKAEQELDIAGKNDNNKTEIFALQRKLRELQNQIHIQQNKKNQARIEAARLETKLENLDRELQEEAPELGLEIKKSPLPKPDNQAELLRPQILKLKHQLELIGGIDKETIQEYEETKERYEFLQNQISDIKTAIADTEEIINELDKKIHRQSQQAFDAINKEFKKYFKILFGGGECNLIKITSNGEENNNDTTLDRAIDALARENQEENTNYGNQLLKKINNKKDIVIGIEIQATPPGKRLKALNLLSGGERALVSIALLSAIMATNPSPFVVLDEVDAALDEANTVRFANILNKLREMTQFIVITHNRATMERADILYGVTMNDNGISNLLSVNLQDVADNGTSRR